METRRTTANNSPTTYLGNHTTCTNSRTLTNRHTRKYSHITPNPAILTNGNWSTHLRTLHAISHRRINRVGPSEQAHARPKQSAVPNRNGQAVDKDAIRVDEHIFADDHVESVVSLDGGFDPGLVFEELIVCYWVVELRGKRGLVLDDTSK